MDCCHCFRNMMARVARVLTCIVNNVNVWKLFTENGSLIQLVSRKCREKCPMTTRTTYKKYYLNKNAHLNLWKLIEFLEIVILFVWESADLKLNDLIWKSSNQIKPMDLIWDFDWKIEIICQKCRIQKS